MTQKITIGIDLDNTIVNYDNVYANLYPSISNRRDAIENLSKKAFKDYVLDHFGNDYWTKLQGEIYGPQMNYASLYPGCYEQIKSWLCAGINVTIVSHRSKFPYGGQQYNLHSFGKEWIDTHLNEHTKFSNFAYKFCETFDQKIEKINKILPIVFIDDLLQVLSSRDFPSNCRKILFEPNSDESDAVRFQSIYVANSWKHIGEMVTDQLEDFSEDDLKS